MLTFNVYSILLICTTFQEIIQNFNGVLLSLQSSLVDRLLHPCYLFCLVFAAFIECLLHVVTSFSCCPFSIVLAIHADLEPFIALDHVLYFADVCCFPSLQKTSLHLLKYAMNELLFCYAGTCVKWHALGVQNL